MLLADHRARKDDFLNKGCGEANKSAQRIEELFDRCECGQMDAKTAAKEAVAEMRLFQVAMLTAENTVYEMARIEKGLADAGAPLHTRDTTESPHFVALCTEQLAKQ